MLSVNKDRSISFFLICAPSLSFSPYFVGKDWGCCAGEGRGRPCPVPARRGGAGVSHWDVPRSRGSLTCRADQAEEVPSVPSLLRILSYFSASTDTLM